MLKNSSFPQMEAMYRGISFQQESRAISFQENEEYYLFNN